MRIVRLTEDKFVLDAGRDMTSERVQELGRLWTEWWEEHGTVPTAFVIGGHREPLEYVDARVSDLEGRLLALEVAIEKHRHGV